MLFSGYILFLKEQKCPSTVPLECWAADLSTCLKVEILISYRVGSVIDTYAE